MVVEHTELNPQQYWDVTVILLRDITLVNKPLNMTSKISFNCNKVQRIDNFVLFVIDYTC